METNKRFYIYKITLLKGSLAGKYYYGKRHLKKGINNPMADGYYGSGAIIKKYYKKYPFEQGITAIKEILEFNDTEEENRKREIFYIGDKYNTDPYCLNLKAGGIGGTWSEDIKTKMSNSMKCFYMSEKGIENRLQKKERLKGKPSQFGSGPLTEEHKNRISESLKGKQRSEESRKKQSNSMKLVPSHFQSVDTKRKISEKLKGKPKSEEAKLHMKEAQQKRWANKKSA